MNQKLNERAANAAVDVVTVMLSGGKLYLYDGAQPRMCAATGRSFEPLATLLFGPIAFAPAESGTALANAIIDDQSAARSGKATWFRACAADGTPIFDGDVGKSGANLNLNNPSIEATARVSVTRFTYTHGKASDE